MRKYLKPLLPRSLFGRAALILVVPIVAIQLLVSLIFIQRHFEGVTRQMTQNTMIELGLALSDVAAAPDLAEAQAKVQALARALRFEVELPVTGPLPTEDKRAFWDWSGRVVIQQLRDALPGLQTIDLVSGRGKVLSWFDTPHGPMLLTIDRRKVSASNPHQLLVLMVVASAVLTFVAYVFLKNQLTPISRLAAAAEAFGKGISLPYRARGAAEVRAAGTAFLDMRGRIERQIEQRTLMLSGVSHDLRTPLTRLKLGLAFLPEDAEQAAMLEDVAQMERLVDEFLAFSRGDAMEVSETVDPVHLIRGVVENASRSGQKVTIGRIEGQAEVRMRKQAIVRALENLIGNAVRYGSRAVVSLLISDRMVRFVIEDDGPGIDKDKHADALIPFQRLDAARDPNRGGGVGLGLSIAVDVARSHGGDLRLDESKGLGGLRVELRIAR